MDDLTIFTVLDRNYSYSSLVSLHSFRRYHKHKVVVYCLDFTEDEFNKYRSNVEIIGNISLVLWDTKDIDSKYYEWNTCYCDIFQQISSKFDIINSIESEWILYFDNDTVFVNNIDDIFENRADLNGCLANKSQPHINCGLFLLHNRNIDWWKSYIDYCENHSTDFLGIDEGFLHSIYNSSTRYIPRTYNSNGYDEVTGETKMIHYMGPIKPFMVKQDINVVCFEFSKHFDIWYQYYDSTLDLFNYSEEFKNEVSRVRAIHFNTAKIAAKYSIYSVFKPNNDSFIKVIMRKMLTDYKYNRK